MRKENDRSNYLLKNTVVFAIGNFTSKLITFLLVPLYTNVLSSSEYGTVDLLYTVCNFLVPLFTFNISESVLRFSLDKNKDSIKISSISLISMAFLVIAGIITIPILKLFESYSKFSILFYIYLITLGISQILLVSLKGKEKLKLFSLGNIIYTFSIAVFNIIFLVVFRLGINGYFLGYIVSNVVVIIYSLISGNFLSEIRKFCFDKTLFKKMVKYSIVLIPTSFMWWIMNFMDRVMVTNIISSSANGIYAISYKIPTILSVISSIFTQAWLFSAIKENQEDDAEFYTNSIFEKLSTITILTASFLVIIIKPLFKIYVSANFYESWQYVPILLFGYVFLTLSTFVSTSYNVNKDSRGLLYSASIGAIMNVILNFILIPVIGIYGAAIATSVSYISVFIFRIFNTKKYIKMNLSNRFYFGIVSLLLIILVTYFFDNHMIFDLVLFGLQLMNFKLELHYIVDYFLTLLKQRKSKTV